MDANKSTLGAGVGAENLVRCHFSPPLLCPRDKLGAYLVPDSTNSDLQYLAYFLIICM
jgi:hypothetical protein